MKIEEIKKTVHLAIDSVKDVPEPFKTKAFEIILSNLLAEFSPKKPLPLVNEEKQPVGGVTTIEDKIEKLAKIANIEVNQSKDIFQFGEKEPIFIGRVEGTEAESRFESVRWYFLFQKKSMSMNGLKVPFC